MEYLVNSLRERLLQLPAAKKPGNTSEIACVRCPICGDSVHKDSSHFYIGVKKYMDKEHIVCYCQLCTTSSLLTPSILGRLGINDLEIDSLLKKVNKREVVKSFGASSDISDIKTNYIYPEPEADETYKVEYVSKRLGMDMGKKENYTKYRVVYNYQKFLQINNIAPLSTIDAGMVKLLSKVGVGFVSSDKTKISIRNFDSSVYGLPRFNILSLYDNVKRTFMYIPPCKVDIMSQNPHIAIAESCFNIINVQKHFYKYNQEDVIYGASARRGCLNTIKRLIAATGFTSGKIDIYADNDRHFDPAFYADLLSPLTTSNNSYQISLILNQDVDPATGKPMKDFGEQPVNGTDYKTKIIRI